MKKRISLLIIAFLLFNIYSTIMFNTLTFAEPVETVMDTVYETDRSPIDLYQDTPTTNSNNTFVVNIKDKDTGDLINDVYLIIEGENSGFKDNLFLQNGTIDLASYYPWGLFEDTYNLKAFSVAGIDNYYFYPEVSQEFTVSGPAYNASANIELEKKYLPTEFLIRGRVIDYDTGKPLEGVVVGYEFNNSGTVNDILTNDVITDSNGEFTISHGVTYTGYSNGYFWTTPSFAEINIKNNIIGYSNWDNEVELRFFDQDQKNITDKVKDLYTAEIYRYENNTIFSDDVYFNHLYPWYNGIPLHWVTDLQNTITHAEVVFKVKKIPVHVEAFHTTFTGLLNPFEGNPNINELQYYDYLHYDSNIVDFDKDIVVKTLSYPGYIPKKAKIYMTLPDSFPECELVEELNLSTTSDHVVVNIPSGKYVTDKYGLTANSAQCIVIFEYEPHGEITINYRNVNTDTIIDSKIVEASSFTNLNFGSYFEHTTPGEEKKGSYVLYRIPAFYYDSEGRDVKLVKINSDSDENNDGLKDGNVLEIYSNFMKEYMTKNGKEFILADGEDSIKYVVLTPDNPNQTVTFNVKEKIYGAIIVKHIDIDTGEVLQEQNFTRNLGFNTVWNIWIYGYELAPGEPLSKTVELTEIEPNKIIEFFYKKIEDTPPPIVKGSIAIKYIDDSGNILDEEVLSDLNLGDHTVNAKSFAGYTLNDSTSKTVNLTEEEPDKTVTFFYKAIKRNDNDKDKPKPEIVIPDEIEEGKEPKDPVIEINPIKGKISGRVYLLENNDRVNQENIKIKLYDSNNNLINELLTNSEGFTFLDLEIGKYYVEAILNDELVSRKAYFITEDYQTVELTEDIFEKDVIFELMINHENKELPKTGKGYLDILLNIFIVFIIAAILVESIKRKSC